MHDFCKEIEHDESFMTSQTSDNEDNYCSYEIDQKYRIIN